MAAAGRGTPDGDGAQAGARIRTHLDSGPYDTVFLAGGVLFVLGGLAAISPMRSKESLAAAAGAVAERAAAKTGGEGPAVAPAG